MGKKKAGTKYRTEEEAYEDLQRLIQVWKNKETWFSYSKKSFLRSLKKEFRSQRICQLIFSNFDIFNLEEELQNMPTELMTEDFLMRILYDNPRLIYYGYQRPLGSVTKEIKEAITEEIQTLPVLVAFELGKRRFEKYSAMEWGQYGEKIPYTRKALKFRRTILEIADKVEDKIGINNLKHSQAYEDEDERELFISELISTIQEELDLVGIQEDEHYTPKYDILDYNNDKKLLILVEGYADSGKTVFSQYLASRIHGAISLDSDQLIDRGLLESDFSQMINSKRRVVVFSDLDAFRFFSPEEIKKAMGDANILKVYIEPASVKRMLQHSKFRRRS